MSSCNPSTASSDVVFCIDDSSSLFRFQRVLSIIVLMLCVLVIPVCGQLNQQTCGKRQLPPTVFLITYGVASPPGRWPWHAAIYIPIGRRFTYGCGGSIIARNAILTAAHCLSHGLRPLKKSEISVHVGRVDLNGNTTALQILAASELIIHPGFEWPNVAHDIAIIKLSSDIAMSQFVHPVCVWTMNNDLIQIVGKQGTVIGFGRNEHDELPGFLQEAPLTVVDNQACLENDRIAYAQVLTRNVYCAGGQRGVSACNGDSGGGMYFEIDGTWFLRGLISSIAGRSNGLCDPSKYTIFTDVSKYSNWVSQYIDSPMRPSHRTGSGFLLVNSGNDIIRVPLNGGQIIRVIEVSNVQGYDFDCVKGRFYWADSNQKRIFNLHGSVRKPFIKDGISFPRGMAIHWSSRQIYWADEEKKTIEVASLENPNVRTVLISTNLIEPYGIAVDSLRHKLYWSDANKIDPKIEWSNLDGSGRQILIGSSLIDYPLSIHVFDATGELCYIDNFYKIQCIDPFNKKIRSIANNLTSATGLAISDERFFWNNQLQKRIESINMDGVRQQPITSPLFKGDLFGMKLVTGKCPIIYSPCATNNGGCPENTICLVNPGAPLGKSCKLWENGSNASKLLDIGSYPLNRLIFF